MGYNIYYGTTSHNYTNVVSAGNAMTVTIGGLVSGLTYYFAATSYDAQDRESSFSGEASYTVPGIAINNLAVSGAPSANVVTTPNVVTGQNVSLAGAVQGTGPVQYQWQFNASNLAAATNAVLNLNNVTTAQAGTYSLQMIGSNGVITNLAASLTIYPTAAATLTPVSFTNGQYAFKVSGVPGNQYVVQTSTNLQNWTSVRTNTAPFIYMDSNAGQSKQAFYRTVSLFDSNSSSSLGNASATAAISPAPAVLIGAVYSGGQYCFIVLGTAGIPYVVQASTNLLDWVALQTNTAPFNFTDPNAGKFAKRFYRVLAPSPTPALTASLTVSANTAATLIQPLLANGQYAFTVAGMTGNPYVVQASTNLVDWISVATNTAPFQFVDPAAGQFKQRFYRAF